MTLSEILKAKGITEEIIKGVLDEMRANNIFTASEENLDVRYGKLKTKSESESAQLKEANNLIAELKKSAEGQGDLQQKVTAYEQQIATLQAQLEETQIDADMHVALLENGANPEDIEFLMFTLKNKGKLERGEDGKVKDAADKIAALKTQRPAHFISDSKKNVIENRLPDNKEDRESEPKTLSDALRMQYEQKN